MKVIKLLLILLISIPSHALGMQQLPRSLQEILYAITPASGNPLTWFGNNFHAVEEGRAYRSKTMSPSDLASHIDEHKIKTIINLREADGIWYEKEDAVATSKNVKLHTVTLNANQLPTRKQLKEILNYFQTAPQPILFHCQAGVDRTSLVAAFWKLTIQNESLEQAYEQMTPSYGHFEWSKPLMRKCIALLDATRGADGKIDLDKYNPEEAMKKIALNSLPVRATKSLVASMKNNPKTTASVIALGAATAALSFYFLRK